MSVDRVSEATPTTDSYAEQSRARTDVEVGSVPRDISPVRYAQEQKPVSWRHGTETCYVNHGCRRPECRDAHRKARSRRHLLFDSGRAPAWMTNAQLRPHLRALMGQGWTSKRIGDTAGVHRGAVDAVLRSDAGKVRYATGVALMGVRGEPSAGLVASGLTHHRVGSLMRAGWQTRTIRAEAGLACSDKAWPWRQQHVQVRVARAIRTLFAAAGDRKGGSRSQTVSSAIAKGWPLPAEWDDPGTLAWPEGKVWRPAAAVRRLGGQQVVWDELRWADVEWLRSFGLTEGVVAERLGVSRETLSRAERRRVA